MPRSKRSDAKVYDYGTAIENLVGFAVAAVEYESAPDRGEVGREQIIHLANAMVGRALDAVLAIDPSAERAVAAVHADLDRRYAAYLDRLDRVAAGAIPLHP